MLPLSTYDSIYGNMMKYLTKNKQMPTFNPEQILMNSPEANEVSANFVNLIYEQIKPKIDNSRIKETDFSIYDKTKIENDIKKVKAREKWFAENDNPEQKKIKKCADILEYTIYERLEMDDWLCDFVDSDGDPTDPEIVAETALASKYDDLFNGADVIFKSGGTAGTSRVSVFSIDTTFVHNEAALSRKNWDSYNLVQQGGLANIEYYKSGNFTGRVENVPRFIIGVDMLQMLEIAKYLYADSTSSNLSEIETMKTELGYKVVTQLFVEATVMSQLAKNEFDSRVARGDDFKQLSSIYDNLSAARSYFAQAHDKMSIILKRGNHGQPYRLQHEDHVHEGIINYYNGILKEKALAPKVGARALGVALRGVDEVNAS